jgi:hypothetical protein
MDDKRLDRIEDKIDKIVEHTAYMDVTLAKQHVSLDEHIKRTTQIEAELLPIKAHVNKVKGAIALLTFLAGITALIEAIRMLIK